MLTLWHGFQALQKIYLLTVQCTLYNNVGRQCAFRKFQTLKGFKPLQGSIHCSKQKFVFGLKVRWKYPFTFLFKNKFDFNVIMFHYTTTSFILHRKKCLLNFIYFTRHFWLFDSEKLPTLMYTCTYSPPPNIHLCSPYQSAHPNVPLCSPYQSAHPNVPLCSPYQSAHPNVHLCSPYQSAHAP